MCPVTACFGARLTFYMDGQEGWLFLCLGPWDSGDVSGVCFLLVVG